MAVSHFHSWNISLGQSSPVLPEKRPYFSRVGSALRNLSQAHSGTESPRPWDGSFIIVLGEISLSLLCSHSSLGSALDLDPPLHVGCLRAYVLCSDMAGLKEQLIR